MSCLVASAGSCPGRWSPTPIATTVGACRFCSAATSPQVLHDPCGSVSTRSTDRRRSCHSTATAIAVVVFPDPPFCPAKAMITTHTYHRHPQTPNSICNRPRTSTDVCRRSLASMCDTAISRAAPAPHTGRTLPPLLGAPFEAVSVARRGMGPRASPTHRDCHRTATVIAAFCRKTMITGSVYHKHPQTSADFRRHSQTSARSQSRCFRLSL